MLLYYITDRAQFPGDDSARWSALLGRIRSAAAAGVDFVQLREKDLPARELESLALEASAAIAGTKTQLLMNHRLDVAVAIGTTGVHLRSGPGELSAAEARTLFASAGIAKPVIAVSCHTLEEVRLAEQDGADFVVFSPVFGKYGSNGTGIGTLREVSSAVKVPVLALGGISRDNAGECMRAGAVGVAGIRLFQTGEINATVAALRGSSDRR